jgi:hypothetical protein
MASISFIALPMKISSSSSSSSSSSPPPPPQSDPGQTALKTWEALLDSRF